MLFTTTNRLLEFVVVLDLITMQQNGSSSGSYDEMTTRRHFANCYHTWNCFAHAQHSTAQHSTSTHIHLHTYTHTHTQALTESPRCYQIYRDNIKWRLRRAYKQSLQLLTNQLLIRETNTLPSAVRQIELLIFHTHCVPYELSAR